MTERRGRLRELLDADALCVTLTAEEREALAAWWASEWPRDESDVLDALAGVVEAIVAARVSEAVERALRPVEAQIERLGTGDHHCFKPWCPTCASLQTERYLADALRAAVAAGRENGEG